MKDFQDARDPIKETPLKVTLKCHICGSEMIWSGRGRMKRFCSDRCRMRAIRAVKKKEKSNATR